MIEYSGYIFLNLNHPLVCWEVYRGEFISTKYIENGSVPSMLFSNLIFTKNNSRLKAELLIDAVRAKTFKDNVSRMTGLYVFRDLQSAQIALEWGNYFIFDNLVEVKVEVENESEVTKVDANWISVIHELVKQDKTEEAVDSINQYWSGKTYNNIPCWEYIFNGKATVIGDSQRHRAFEIIKDNFPTSIPMLELSRIAFLIGYNLGQITPFIQSIPEEPNNYRLFYIMNLKEIEKTEFKGAIRNYLNVQSKTIKGTLTTPNLIPYSRKFTISKYDILGYAGIKIEDIEQFD